MTVKKLLALALIVGLPAVIAAFAIADEPKDTPPAANQPAPPLPPGWTEEDMKACMLAGTPGKMHEFLASSVGVWYGKNKMWMAPETPAVESETVTTISPMFDGRYTKAEIEGEMPGMGPFKGLGVYGFDNVAQTFVSTWIDNQSTGIMNGTGELSADGKVLTWKFTFSCPLTKKPAVIREIETITGPNTKTIDMFSTDPKSGKEFKMMSMMLTKKSDVAQADK